jgi:hypothetical protein
MTPVEFSKGHFVAARFQIGSDAAAAAVYREDVVAGAV